MSAAHRLAARRAFAAQLSRGEAGIRLATAALLMAAEDDAIGTLGNSHRVLTSPPFIVPGHSL